VGHAFSLPRVPQIGWWECDSPYGASASSSRAFDRSPPRGKTPALPVVAGASFEVSRGAIRVSSANRDAEKPRWRWPCPACWRQNCTRARLGENARTRTPGALRTSTATSARRGKSPSSSRTAAWRSTRYCASARSFRSHARHSGGERDIHSLLALAGLRPAPAFATPIPTS